MKLCTKCKVVKGDSEFNKGRGERGLHSYCRACQKVHYQDNRERHIANVVRNKAIRMESVHRSLLEYLAEHPCVDCLIDNPVVLEFDHRDPVTKSANVGEMIAAGFSWANILTEINKCDVRCANCHRIRTASQQGWRKALPLVPLDG